MTSSSKPEVHNVSQRRHRKAEPRPQATCAKKLVKLCRVAFELCERTDKQTDILIAIFRIPPGAEAIIITHLCLRKSERGGQFCPLRQRQVLSSLEPTSQLLQLKARVDRRQRQMCIRDRMMMMMMMLYYFVGVKRCAKRQHDTELILVNKLEVMGRVPT